VKTKLRKGAYIIMLTTYDRLGGSPLSWNKTEILETLPICTSAVSHQGRYFDRCISFEESLFAVCPGKMHLRPSYCLIFELFELKSKFSPSSRPIAWAALPMCNEHFSFISGKFKLPLIKGEHSPATKLYSQIEASIASDINTWLCNMYIEIKLCPLPQGLIDSSTTVGLNFIQKFVSVKDSTKPNYHAEENEEDGHIQLSTKIKPPSGTLDSNLFLRNISREGADFDTASSLKFRVKPHQKESPHNDKNVRSLSWVFKRERNIKNVDTRFEGDIEDDKNRAEKETISLWQKDPLSLSEDQEVIEKGYNSEDELFLLPEQTGELMGIETISSKEAQQWAAIGLDGRMVRRAKFAGSRYDKFVIRSEAAPNSTARTEFRSDKNQPLRRIHSNKELSFSRGDSVRSKVGGDPVNVTQNTWQPLHDEAHFSEYQMSIVNDPANRVQLLPPAIAAVKAKFLISEIFIDLIGDKSRYFVS